MKGSILNVGSPLNLNCPSSISVKKKKKKKIKTGLSLKEYRTTASLKSLSSKRTTSVLTTN